MYDKDNRYLLGLRASLKSAHLKKCDWINFKPIV